MQRVYNNRVQKEDNRQTKRMTKSLVLHENRMEGLRDQGLLWAQVRRLGQEPLAKDQYAYCKKGHWTCECPERRAMTLSTEE